MSNQSQNFQQSKKKANPLLNVVLPIFMLLVFLGLIAVASFKLMGTRNDDYAEKVKAQMEQKEAVQQAKKDDTTAELKKVERS